MSRSRTPRRRPVPPLRWFDIERYDPVARFGPMEWAQQIYRRMMIRQALGDYITPQALDESRQEIFYKEDQRQPHAGATADVSGWLTQAIEGLKSTPLGVPDWVKDACRAPPQRRSSARLLTVGDLREMLSEWRYGASGPDEDEDLVAGLGEEDGEPAGSAGVVPEDSPRLIDNALPYEDRVTCTGFYSHPGGGLFVHIDDDAPEDQMLDDVKELAAKARELFKLAPRIDPRLAPAAWGKDHPWVIRRILPYFDLTTVHEYLNGEPLGPLNVARVLCPAERGPLSFRQRIPTFRKEMHSAITYETWSSLMVIAAKRR